MTPPHLRRAESIALSFEQTLATAWKSWPAGHCAVSSLLLAPILRAADPEPEWRVAIGIVLERNPHAWVQSVSSDIVDPTWSQFDDYPNADYDIGAPRPSLRVVSRDEIGTDYELYKCFDLAEEEIYRQSITTYDSRQGPIYSGSDLKHVFRYLRDIGRAASRAST